MIRLVLSCNRARRIKGKNKTYLFKNGYLTLLSGANQAHNVAQKELAKISNGLCLSVPFKALEIISIGKVGTVAASKPLPQGSSTELSQEAV